ncbi:hypothetical protein GIB67_021405 [Kingdonia uniflora]|uniref:Uncharacterized protein n=1 Tax=Kingdonia uniflora TaxID=39325 RepID=A0A7J7MCY0_9MAGN|nr:hypothetical protein GIB67_021405 [Kingdonia uniflora]
MKNLASPSLSKLSLLLQMETTTKQPKKKKWVLPLVISLILSSLVVITSFFTPKGFIPFYQPTPVTPKPVFIESKLKPASLRVNPVPRIAYLISGSTGDGESLKRTLRALYHPLNQYVVHLDLEASPTERLELVNFVRSDPVFVELGNVRVIVHANLVTYRGPTMVSNTLHAAAILLKEGGDWDWFINLSASDYPLVTQDDFLHTLSTIPRHLNFIEHTSDIGWKESQRARPVIIDPGLYSSKKSDVFWASEQRNIPTAFKLFTGSAWMMLSRPFIEFCIWGWDNLPRTVLMYYANFLSSPEGYFHTVICNVEEFRNTTVNHDLHFISWDTPPKQHPHFLTNDDFQRMVESNSPFARKFGHNEAVLDKIDTELLGRAAHGFVPSGWLKVNNGVNTNTSISDYTIGNVTDLRPGEGAERIQQLIKVQCFQLRDTRTAHSRRYFYVSATVLRGDVVDWVEATTSFFEQDSRPIMLFDGVCNLCNGGVKFVRDNDRKRNIRFEALQSESGKKLLQRSGRAPDDISSVVLVEKERSYIKSEAVLKIMEYLDLPFPQLALFLQFVPLFLWNFMYDNVADNRYTVFGRSESCEL